MVGKWLLAIFHHVSALSIYVRNSIYEGNKSISCFFPLSGYFRVENGNVFSLFVCCLHPVEDAYTVLPLLPGVTETCAHFSLCPSLSHTTPCLNSHIRLKLRKKVYIYKETLWKIFFSLFNTEQKFIIICPGIILKEKHCSCADRYNLDDAQFILNGRLHSFFILTLNHLIYFEITKQWSMDWGHQNWKKFNDMQVK